MQFRSHQHANADSQFGRKPHKIQNIKNDIQIKTGPFTVKVPQ